MERIDNRETSFKICNNSNLDFKVVVSSDGLESVSHKIAAHSRLFLSDFFNNEIIKNKKDFVVEVLYDGELLQKYSHVPQEVYIALVRC